jgi:hypothetical protein
VVGVPAKWSFCGCHTRFFGGCGVNRLQAGNKQAETGRPIEQLESAIRPGREVPGCVEFGDVRQAQIWLVKKFRGARKTLQRVFRASVKRANKPDPWGPPLAGLRFLTSQDCLMERESDHNNRWPFLGDAAVDRSWVSSVYVNSDAGTPVWLLGVG